MKKIQKLEGGNISIATMDLSILRYAVADLYNNRTKLDVVTVFQSRSEAEAYVHLIESKDARTDDSICGEAVIIDLDDIEASIKFGGGEGGFILTDC